MSGFESLIKWTVLKKWGRAHIIAVKQPAELQLRQVSFGTIECVVLKTLYLLTLSAKPVIKHQFFQQQPPDIYLKKLS